MSELSYLEEEALIKAALLRLIPGAAVEVLVRTASGEMTREELLELTPALQEKWLQISAPHRKLEWSEARRCERGLRTVLGAEAKTSISHTRAGRLSVVFAVGAIHTGPIGVDVELGTRTLTEDAARRFTRSGEKSLALESLELWVIKEAVLKAYPGNSGTVPGQYRVVSFDPDSGIGKAVLDGSSDSAEIRFARLKTRDWVVAVAVS